MKRLLFNATHPEELRVAIVDGQKLLDLDIESAIRNEKKGNIYKAVVTKVEQSLEAAFVDYGAEKHGFLPLKEIYRKYFQNYDGRTAINNVRIEQVIKEGQEMIVQVDKDERGNKGAALTTFISLAGRFLVLMPNNPKGGGISRRISGEDRADLRDILSNLDVSPEHALIARTAGIGRSKEELQWDLTFLNKLWQSIEKAAENVKGPFLIYQDSNLIVRTIRDHLSSDISEIIIDDEEIFERAERFMNQVMPHNLARLKLYQGTIPLFSRYQIENQIESAFTREVNLPSGGSIVIDHTEALISVDVNSARATKGGDIEETAFRTNLEAVEEVARQLRIRDIGGLVVIDLIDMTINENQRSVENRLKEALRPDRARVQIGRISRFGLLEMSRQRLRSSISDANYLSCPRCNGTGIIRSVVSSSLNLLRLIEDEALKENTEAIQVDLPLDMATFLLNEKRHELNQLESRLASRIIIIPNEGLQSPHFTIRRLRGEELEALGQTPSYEQKSVDSSRQSELTNSLKSPERLQASVEIDNIEHTAPPTPAAPSKKPVKRSPSNQDNAKVKADEPVGLLKRIARSLFGTDTRETKKPQAGKPAGTRERPAPRRGKDNRRNEERFSGNGRRGSGSKSSRNIRGRGDDGQRTQGNRAGNDQGERRQQPHQKQSRAQGQGRGGQRRSGEAGDSMQGNGQHLKSRQGNESGRQQSRGRSSNRQLQDAKGASDARNTEGRKSRPTDSGQKTNAQRGKKSQGPSGEQKPRKVSSQEKDIGDRAPKSGKSAPSSASREQNRSASRSSSIPSGNGPSGQSRPSVRGESIDKTAAVHTDNRKPESPLETERTPPAAWSDAATGKVQSGPSSEATPPSGNQS